MTTRFCTLFDVNYAARGLVMLESLARHHPQPFEVYVLALDEGAHRLAQQLGRGAWRVLAIADLGDDELMALQGVRPHREFCWTCTPALSDYLVRTGAAGDDVCYLDADMMFFADPQVLIDELEADGSILIHEHRYSANMSDWETSAGRFNVGFVGFRIGEEAQRCTGRWRAQVIEKCVRDPENGYCGDQGYLNEWPQLYPGLRIMANIGGGVAPWNVAQYEVRDGGCGPCVDGVPVVFYHYHALRAVVLGRLGMIAALPSLGYSFSRDVHRHLYMPYARRLRRAIARQRAIAPVRSEHATTLLQTIRGLRGGTLVPAVLA